MKKDKFKRTSRLMTKATLLMFLGCGIAFSSCSDDDTKYDEQIDGLEELVNKNGATLDQKTKELETALTAVKQELASAKEATEKAKEEAKKAQNTADDAAKEATASILLAKEAKEAAAKAKEDALEGAKKLIEELRKEMLTEKDLNTAITKINVTIAAVQGNLDGVKKELANFKGGLDDLKGGLADINGTLDSFKEDLNGFNGKLEDFVEKEAFEEALDIQKKTLENFNAELEKLEGLVGEQALTLKSELEKVTKDVKDLQAKMEEQNGALQDSLKEEIEKVSAEISAVQGELNIVINLLSKRLTSLVFSPETYINGIEAINFATLQYNPWKERLADGPGTTKVTSINDGKTTASYFANPSHVIKENIKELTVLTQDATNTITRASEEGKLISATLGEIKDGKLIVNLKKNTTNPFTTVVTDNKDVLKESFKIMALQAEVELTEAEVEAGVSPYVTSDFVRLAEEPVKPYIHNAEAKDEEGVAHFYKYTDIVDGDPATTQGKCILKELNYKERLDLNELVEVCTKDGKTKLNPSDYGLAFEFNLIKEYNLKDNPEEVTNQQSFAKIDDEGILYSTSRNGTENNKDAVGREPVIQIVLKNTSNKEDVDVRYFKVKWEDDKPTIESQDLGNLELKDQDKGSLYVCDGVVTNYVGTKEMNDKIYTEIGENGISKEKFHELYELDQIVYGSLVDAQEGVKPATKLGTLEDIVADGPTHTHNLKWIITDKDIDLTEAELKAGKAVRTVYGRYIEKANKKNFFTFNLEVVINVEKMEFAAGYLQTYWNKGAELVSTNPDKSFQVNPALTDDEVHGVRYFKDCQILADILTGYNIKDVNPDDLDLGHLVVNAEKVQFVFDADRLNLLGKDWTVSKDGKQLVFEGTVAAQLDDKATIQLFENPFPTVTNHGKPTTSAQLLLGKNIPVKIAATHCSGLTLDVDHFLVNIINPLAMTLTDVKGSFQDLLTGGSKVSVNKLVSITETFGRKRDVWKDGVEAIEGLVSWYNVENITWDLDNARTNLTIDGNNIIISNDPQATEWSKFGDKYQVSTKDDGKGNVTELIFRNNSGAHIQQEFVISVPVYVKTKWSPKLNDTTKEYVIIKVTPGDVTR